MLSSMGNPHLTIAMEYRSNDEWRITWNDFRNAKRLHAKETILLLPGEASEYLINVSEVVIPPLATHGKGFSSLSAYMLPEDFPLLE